MPKPKFSLILFALTVALSLLSLAYLAKGFYTLALEPGRLGARDLLERWKEQQYIYLGIYPYHISASEIEPSLGRLYSGGYPPWSFFTGFLVFPNISWQLTRFYHVFLNLISLAILAKFAYQIGLPFGIQNAYLFMASSLAISSNCTTLNNGQYGIIINAILIRIFWLLNNNKNYWAGLLMGMALAKPSISAPYFLILIVKKKIKSLLLAIFYIAFATFSISRLTQLSLWELLNSFLQHIEYVGDDGKSAINFLVNFRVDSEMFIFFLTIAIAMVSVAIFYYMRNFSLLTLFAAASVIGRVFTYHRSYDNVMLVFLLLALLEAALSQPNRLNILMVTLVGLTLWLPAGFKIISTPFWSNLQITIWLFALAYLLLISFWKSRAKSNNQLTE